MEYSVKLSANNAYKTYYLKVLICTIYTVDSTVWAAQLYIQF